MDHPTNLADQQPTSQSIAQHVSDGPDSRQASGGGSGQKQAETTGQQPRPASEMNTTQSNMGQNPAISAQYSGTSQYPGTSQYLGTSQYGQQAGSLQNPGTSQSHVEYSAEPFQQFPQASQYTQVSPYPQATSHQYTQAAAYTQQQQAPAGSYPQQQTGAPAGSYTQQAAFNQYSQYPQTAASNQYSQAYTQYPQQYSAQQAGSQNLVTSHSFKEMQNVETRPQYDNVSGIYNQERIGETTYTGPTYDQSTATTTRTTQRGYMGGGTVDTLDTAMSPMMDRSGWAGSSIGNMYAPASSYASPPFRSVSAATETSRVVGHQFGQERVISVTSRVDESRSHIVSERFIETEVRIPKRIVREEIIEKTIVIPETVRVEEITEEIAKIREKIVEISRPTIVEKIVEVPEIEYVERIVEVPEKRVIEKIREVEKVVVQEKIIEVKRVIEREKFVEVPEVRIIEVPVERIVEIEELKEEVIVKEVPKVQMVEKEVRTVVQVPSYVDVDRTMPVPVEAIVNYEYKLPIIKPKYRQITYPVYLPHFKEVPVAIDLLENTGLIAHAETHLAQINLLTNTNASLAEVEKLATQIMDADLVLKLQQSDLQTLIIKSWQTSGLATSTTTTKTTTYETCPY